MEKYQEIMQGHYVRELSGTIFIVFLSVVAFVFVLIAIKDGIFLSGHFYCLRLFCQLIYIVPLE